MGDESNSRPGLFENVNSLIKNLSWPILVLVVFLNYRGPLSQTISELPDLFKRAHEVKVGSVSLTVEEEAKQQDNPELAKALAGLSPDARKLLLKTGTGTTLMWTTTNDLVGRLRYREYHQNGIEELYKRGLIKFKTDPPKFAKFVRDLGLTPGSVHTVQDEDFTDYVPSRPLTSDEQNRLLEQGYSLTELGLKAFNLIVDVVVKS